jgi:hypothetical protein
MLMCSIFMHIAHETAGAARIRSSLRRLYFEGQRNAKLRAHRAARMLLAVITREVIQ